jgi:hypothetical protein
MEEKKYPSHFQYQIEDTVTNSLGFYDSPRNYSMNPDSVDTLIDLRFYLAARVANISLRSIGARDAITWIESTQYMGILNRSIQWCFKDFDLNTSKGIDSAVDHIQQ